MMASNPYVNQLVYAGQVLMDLTVDTVDAAHLAKDYTAHDKSGAPIVGTMESGSSKEHQYDYSIEKIYKTTWTDAFTLTCTKAGTYTFNARLFITSTGKYGYCKIYINDVLTDTITISATYQNNAGQLVSISSLSLSSGDVIRLSWRSYSTAYGLYRSFYELKEE